VWTTSCSVVFTGSAAGGAYLVGTYGGDLTHVGSASAAFVITVNPHATSTSVSCASPVVVGQGSTCTVTVTDTPPSGVPLIAPTGAVSFSSTGSGTFTGTPAGTCSLAAGSIAGTATCSVTYTPSAIGTGIHTITGTYPGDPAHSSSMSLGSSLTVNKIQPTIATALSATTITVGGPVTDSATLINFFQAGGTVAYNVFSGGTCSGTGTVVSSVTVTNGVIPNSAVQTFSSVGTFSWNAVYSGDANNNPATSACERLIVNLPRVIGGVIVPVGKLALLAPYIGLVFLVVVATVATFYVSRIKKRKQRL